MVLAVLVPEHTSPALGATKLLPERSLPQAQTAMALKAGTDRNWKWIQLMNRLVPAPSRS